VLVFCQAEMGQHPVQRDDDPFQAGFDRLAFDHCRCQQFDTRRDADIAPGDNAAHVGAVTMGVEPVDCTHTFGRWHEWHIPELDPFSGKFVVVGVTTGIEYANNHLFAGNPSAMRFLNPAHVGPLRCARTAKPGFGARARNRQ
jgi:hypothetical protein